MKLYSLKPFRPDLKGIVRDNRIAWACEEVGQDFDLVILDPLKKEHKTPEYLKIHPMGKVPAIDDEGFILFESSAICTYLADKHKRLAPLPGTKERTLYNQWMAFTLTQIEAYSVRIFAADKFWEPGELTTKMRAQAVEFLEPALDVLNREFSSKPCLMHEFSMVDLLISHMLKYLSADDLVKRRPALLAYLNRNFDRPAYTKALKKVETLQAASAA